MGEKFRAVIPKNWKAGQTTIRIRCPDRKSSIVNIKIPDGMGPGDALLFELQRNGEPRIVRSEADKNSEKDSNNKAVDVASSRDSFWGREIVNWQDFALSMSVGLMIGMAIILGFFAGVLHVTRYFPIPKDMEGSKTHMMRAQPLESNVHCKHENTGAPPEHLEIPGTQQQQTVCNAK